MGAFRFPARLLPPGEEAEYILLLGVEEDEETIGRKIKNTAPLKR